MVSNRLQITSKRLEVTSTRFEMAPTRFEVISTDRCNSTEGIGTYATFGRDWTSVVTALERFSDRAIVDETGLSGQWDLSLEWNPEITQLPDPTKITSAELEARPIWSTAVREQLGLKLETRTAPTDVLVVERLERPTPD